MSENMVAVPRMLLLEIKRFATRQSALRSASVVSPLPKKLLFEIEFLVDFIRFDKGCFSLLHGLFRECQRACRLHFAVLRFQALSCHPRLLAQTH
ncbi:MAG: hypothetical protein P8J91_15425 [Pirellulaceae bacterium]|nr:hypothetical protein [Pirellulaceae bacterium]